MSASKSVVRRCFSNFGASFGALFQVETRETNVPEMHLRKYSMPVISAPKVTAGDPGSRKVRPSATTRRMGEVAAYIEAHVDESLTLEQLGEVAGMSAGHLQRTFKATIGVSPKEYQAARRLAAFKAGLRAGASVVEAVFDAGYGSTSRVYEQVDGGLGMTPSTYRAGGEGEAIVYAVRMSALGPLMMAATDRGVCFVQFGSDAEELRSLLAAEFPKAELRGAAPEADSGLNMWMEALDAHLSRGAPLPDLPLILRGTAFQIRVWRFLLGVKRGEVVTYAEVARGVGAPRAVRAAASACGANRIGVLVPCHRVLRSDGGLGGYRWGLDRKRVLLDAERLPAATDTIS